MLGNFSHIYIKKSLLGNKLIPYNEKIAKTEEENLEIFNNSKFLGSKSPRVVSLKTIYLELEIVILLITSNFDNEKLYERFSPYHSRDYGF